MQDKSFRDLNSNDTLFSLFVFFLSFVRKWGDDGDQVRRQHEEKQVVIKRKTHFKGAIVSNFIVSPSLFLPR